MLTCNKNFVDLTVWILRSWTCIKLNVYATSESGEGGSQETERQWIIQPHPTTVTQDQTEPDRLGFNQTGSNSVPYQTWTTLNLQSQQRSRKLEFLVLFFAKLDVVWLNWTGLKCVDRWDGWLAGFGWCFLGDVESLHVQLWMRSVFYELFVCFSSILRNI